MANSSLNAMNARQPVDMAALGQQAMTEVAIVTALSLMAGEVMYRLNLFCRHHLYSLAANVFLTTFIFFMVAAMLIGADRFGRRDPRLVKLGWIRWLMLAIGPLLIALIIRD